jgi:hypothetical protein
MSTQKNIHPTNASLVIFEVVPVKVSVLLPLRRFWRGKRKKEKEKKKGGKNKKKQKKTRKARSCQDQGLSTLSRGPFGSKLRLPGFLTSTNLLKKVW